MISRSFYFFMLFTLMAYSLKDNCSSYCYAWLIRTISTFTAQNTTENNSINVHAQDTTALLPSVH